MSRRSFTRDILVFIFKLPYILFTLFIDLLCVVYDFFAWIFKMCFKRNSNFSSASDFGDRSVENKQSPKDIALSYRRKCLLTKHEWSFYQKLKPLADQLGLVVLAKIRIADLVEPVADSRSQYMSLFSKVRSKHIDFVLCRPENLQVELLIELDDSSHIPGNERDAFVEALYIATGYRLYRTYGDVTLYHLKFALGLLEDNVPTDLEITK